MTMVLFALILVVVTLSHISHAWEVEVEVTAPWKTYPTDLLVEIGEHLRLQVPSLKNASSAPVVETFMQNLCAANLVDAYLSSASAGTEQESAFREMVWQAAEPLLSSTQSNLMKEMINIGYYKPVVSFYASLTSTYGTPCEGQAYLVNPATGTIHCEVPEAVPADEKMQKNWDIVLHPSGGGGELVLFGIWGSASFCGLLHSLRGAHVPVVVRHAFPAHLSTSTVLSGYAVWLDVKNSEYKNIDDSASSGAAGGDEDDEVMGIHLPTVAAMHGLEDEQSVSALQTLRADLQELSSSSSSSPSAQKAWKVQDLGLALVTHLSSLSTPEEVQAALTAMTSAFPAHANALSRIKVNETVRKELEAFWSLRTGTNRLTVNGRSLDLDASTFNVHEVLALVKDELAWADKGKGLGIPQAVHEALMQQLTKRVDEVQEQDEDEEEQQVVDNTPSSTALRLDISSGSKEVICWFNNLERDRRYRSWPKALKLLTQPSWSLPAVRRNLYTIVAVVSVLTPAGARTVLEMQMMVEQGYPLRVGYLHHCPADAKGLTQVFCSLHAALIAKEGVGSAPVHAFATSVARRVLSMDGAGMGPLAVEDVLEAFLEVSGLSEVPELDPTLGQGLAGYLTKAGLQPGLLLVNGLMVMTTDGMSSQEFNSILREEQQRLTGYVLTDRLQDSSKSIYADILSLSKGPVVTRYHPFLTANPRFLDIWESGNLDIWASGLIEQLPYLGDVNARDTMVVAVKYTPEGVQTALEALEWFTAQNNNSSVESSVRLALVWYEVPEVGPALDAFNSPEGLAALCGSSSSSAEGLAECVGKYRDILTHADTSSGVRPSTSSVVQKLSHLLPPGTGIGAICFNGYVVPLPGPRPLLDPEAGPVVNFTPADFTLLVQYVRATVTAPLDLLLEGQEAEVSAKGWMEMVSYASLYKTSHPSAHSQGLPSRASLFPHLLHTIPSATSASALAVTMVLDPLSSAGQRGVSLLPLFRDIGLPIELLLTPRMDMTQFPLPNYYQRGGQQQQGVIFKDLPKGQVLTVRLDAPEAWNLQTLMLSEGSDPDNLLTPASPALPSPRVTYSLQSMLFAGQCLDMEQHRPASGVELFLCAEGHGQGQGQEDGCSDTVVMQNLGYYQLQARSGPGIYTLSLANTSTHTLVTADELPQQEVVLKDFLDKVHRVHVQKTIATAQQEEEDALAAAAGAPRSLWQSMTSLFGTSDEVVAPAATAVQGDSDDTVHVFSVATGAVYERLMRIMLLSVSKRTSRPVHFWLFENYLTPAFKTLAARMSAVYGFQISYVTYKWPAWLSPQVDKQRIIWGYKILFLDVLFPLDLHKIIYVDADQVLRGDLADLWDTDLQGAPYGYVPFCTSREDTLGFQFWRQGYWKDHLAGRPYHISALYVVDLDNFRRNKVGDTLRGIYDQLSRDPNSLANLDQDLPNYAQHAVPIHSLPQDWLWCETWCSEDSKASAKTIDLCNNPLHKEPKLDMARRIISGRLFNESWVQLDEEIADLARREGLGKVVEVAAG